MNPKNSEQFHAGVAFFDEEKGEHRLILDGPKTIFYLRPSETVLDEIKFKVFAAVMIRGAFSHRVEVGRGYSNPSTQGQIFMTIGRYEPMRLVLIPNEEE